MDPILDFEKPIAVLQEKLTELRQYSQGGDVDFSSEIASLEAKLDRITQEVYDKLTSWQKIQLSRHPKRPYTLDYIERIFTDFEELHGDRFFAEDPAIVCGLAKLDGTSVLVIGHQKGRSTKEKLIRNFGMAKPEGYRKSQRLMKLAERFKLPVICFIDTPGAFPGVEAEERGQSEAIAKSIYDMFTLKTPLISVVIGEGGSGGALALGISDRVLMQEFATYSVISPESCASILWSDATKGPLAAEALKTDAGKAKDLQVIDEVIPEPKGGAHRDYDEASRLLKGALLKSLKELKGVSPSTLSSQRQKKFREIGHYAFQKGK